MQIWSIGIPTALYAPEKYCRNSGKQKATANGARQGAPAPAGVRGARTPGGRPAQHVRGRRCSIPRGGASVPWPLVSVNVWQRECCLLVLNLVSSTPPCIRQPGPRLLQKLARAPLAPEASRAAHALEAAATVPTLPPAARAPPSVLVLLRSSTNQLRKLLLLLLRQRRLLLQLPFALLLEFRC